MRGVPLRMEIGPKDVAKGTVVLARRDRPGKEGKSFVPQAGHCRSRRASCSRRFRRRFSTARWRSAKRIRAEPADYGEFKKAVEKGFAFSWWCGGGECEEKIKEETKATMRCIPLDQTTDQLGGSGACIYCGKPARSKAIFAKAY